MSNFAFKSLETLYSMKNLSQAIHIASIVREYLQHKSLIDKKQQEELVKNQENISQQLKHIARISK